MADPHQSLSIHHCGDITASEALQQLLLSPLPPKNTTTTNSNDTSNNNTNSTTSSSPPQIMAILLYGSWNNNRLGRAITIPTKNNNTTNNNEQKKHRDNGGDDLPSWVNLLRNAMTNNDNKMVAKNLNLLPHGILECKTASVKVDNVNNNDTDGEDDDEESMNICIDPITNGGFGAPSELPCLLFLGRGGGGGASSPSPSSLLRVEHVKHYHGRALEKMLLSHRPKCNDDNETSVEDLKFQRSVNEALSNLVDDRSGRILEDGPSDSNVIRNNQSNNHTKEKKHEEEEEEEAAIRIFIAGDRSQVGKSSICMGILGALLLLPNNTNNTNTTSKKKKFKYAPNDLAYIKPATQCEATQLVEEFCQSKGIASCVPVGPIVYYKGFTRAFLKGTTSETSQDLLQKASVAVDELAKHKKVIVIDGVGYPAVGSITGTDNASVAIACGTPVVSLPELRELSDGTPTTTATQATPATKATATTTTIPRIPVPVLLVGKSGVGDAIDSFNINATYFAHRNIPVLGAIFNKFNVDGFYSLDNCREAIEMYFDKFQCDKKAFGFLPIMEALANARERVVDNNDSAHTAADNATTATATATNNEESSPLELANLFVEEFAKRVNVELIVKAAREATARYSSTEHHHGATSMETTTMSQKKRPAAAAYVVMEKNNNAAAAATANKNGVSKKVKYSHHHPPVEWKGTVTTTDSGGSVNNGFALTREQIEAMASAAGAAGG